eukprot:scaffold6132_cov60-Phaeocystis_antarctica.AAC.2
MGRWVRWQGSRHERLEGLIFLEGLGDRHAARGAERVAVEAAHTAKAGEQGKGCERGARKKANPCPWFEGRPSCAHLSSVSVVLVFSAAATSLPSSAPTLHRREERAHVLGTEHLAAEVHSLAARRLALELHQRGAVRLDHLVLQVRDERLVVGIGERTAARHATLACHRDLRVAVEGAVQQDGVELHRVPLHLGQEREDEVLDAAAGARQVAC